MALLAVALLILTLPGTARPFDTSYQDKLIAKARLSGLAGDPGWLALLHYKSGRSSFQGAFFLSSKGDHDAEAELEATIEGFFTAPVATTVVVGDDALQHPQCRLPARYAWLKRRLDFDPTLLKEQPCPRLAAWRKAIDADRVTLVYADSSFNRAGSVFGHTFLLFRRHEGGGENGLLDFTLSFAALPDRIDFLYAYKGIAGKFQGRYSMVPYYMKVQRYEEIEGRGLWEYDLNLSTEAVAQLVNHIWETSSATVNYYFFSENCAYQVLALLDAADPELQLTRELHFGVVPADTVRMIVSRPELVTARRYWELPGDSADDKPIEPLPPENGHKTFRWGMGAGVDSHGGFQELSWRGSLHDLLAPEAGYFPNGQLETAALQMRWDDKDRRPYIERLALLDIESLTPIEKTAKPSWEFSTGVEQAKELNCAPESCMFYDMHSGIGISAQAKDLYGQPLFYLFGEGEWGAGPVLPLGWRIGAGGRAGVLIRLSPCWRMLTEGSYIDFPRPESPAQERLLVGQSFSITRNIEARMYFDRRTPISEGGMQLLFYY